MTNNTSIDLSQRREDAKNLQYRTSSDLRYVLSLVVLFLLPVVSVNAQNSIPFASPVNTIELTIGNAATYTAGVVEVELTGPPSWITAQRTSVRFNALAAGASATAVFTFGVDKRAPVGKETALNFTIRSQSGEVWQKQVMIRVEAPSSYELYQNYPNPFNPSTTIEFNLPAAGPTSLRVYDVVGREVAVLLNESLSAGYHSLPFDGSKLSSGVYLYTLRSGSFSRTKRMMVVK